MTDPLSREYPNAHLESGAQGICLCFSFLLGTWRDLGSRCDHLSRKMCWRWQIYGRCSYTTSELSITFPNRRHRKMDSSPFLARLVLWNVLIISSLALHGVCLKTCVELAAKWPNGYECCRPESYEAMREPRISMSCFPYKTSSCMWVPLFVNARVNL